jgi:7-cyano-7-deazaguanine reductase
VRAQRNAAVLDASAGCSISVEVARIRGLMEPSLIETFPNPKPDRNFRIMHECPEFTSVCPKTGNPDFGTITVEYVAGELCIELKSLKQYLFGFRQQGIFYEAVVNQVLDDLVSACQPRWMRVTGSFNVRGGIRSVVTADYGDASCAPTPS